MSRKPAGRAFPAFFLNRNLTGRYVLAAPGPSLDAPARAVAPNGTVASEEWRSPEIELSAVLLAGRCVGSTQAVPRGSTLPSPQRGGTPGWRRGANSLVILYVSSGIGSCAWVALLLYNLVALIGFFRESTEGSASMLSKAAWAVGFFSFLLGPCAWFGGLVAIVLASVERRRIYQDKSSFASATPCRHASVNGWVIIGLTALMFGAGLATYLM